MDIVYHPATVVKTQTKPAEPVRSFYLGEWRAFQNGLLCSLLGHTTAQRDEGRASWSKAHQWAFDAGAHLMDKLMSRADVQMALWMRFGGGE